jgi:hypothetical protein
MNGVVAVIVRKTALACAVTLVAALGVTAPAGASGGAALSSETLWLDMYAPVNDGAAGPVSTSKPLKPNGWHEVTVRGTWAPFNRWNDSMFETCGPAEPHPIYPSPLAPNGGNGPVGVDAEVFFARPSNRVTGSCSDPTRPLPVHNPLLKFDLGAGFRHYEAVGGPYSSPRADHTYTYLVQGAGTTADFSVRFDDNPLTDNYGKFKIVVSALDGERCKKGGWVDFGVFKNQGDCVSYFATDGRNPPALA